MEDPHVFVHACFTNNIKDSALGEMGYVIAIPPNSNEIEIIRYVNYCELDRKKDSELGPIHFIQKMIGKRWNCIVFYGVNSKIVKELYNLSPHPKPEYMKVEDYNRGIVDHALTHLLREDQPTSIPKMLLESRLSINIVMN